MLAKRLNELEPKDIQELCEIGAVESQGLDYKALLKVGSYEERKEFLADISAFANASGGDLIIGVEEDAGIPTAAPGVEIEDWDRVERQLRNLARDGLEPRLVSLEMRWLPKGDGKGFIVVRIPRSWIAPHRVTLQGHDKFYIRQSNAKHPMNVDELRRAFLLADSVASRIAELREERLTAIAGRVTPVPMRIGAKCVLHFVPLASIVDPPNLDFELGAKATIGPPPFTNSGTYTYCLEGIAYYAPTDTHGVSPAYSLMFRTGEAELVCDVPIDPRVPAGQLSQSEIGAIVYRGWKAYKSFMDVNGLLPPVYAALTLFDVAGFTAPLDNLINGSPTQHRVLRIPPTLVQAGDLNATARRLFEPTLDIVANAFGYGKFHWPMQWRD